MLQTISHSVKKFLALESAGGIVLAGAAVLAMVIANSEWSSTYTLLIDTPVAISIGSFEIAKPLLLWVNDGLMAVFFFLIGLELKREVVEGELSDMRSIMLPGLGAFGGMVVPAAIYVAFNYNDPVAMKGWAIPAATDIAFALGILSLLGSRVPTSLKIFLTSLAIFDDIGAIIIIALFYTSNISLAALGGAGVCLVALFLINRSGYEGRSLYITVGIIMWAALLKSGVHATLAGVLLAMFIPLRSRGKVASSPLKSLEHDLHTAVAYIILPVFAFCNSGVQFSDLSGDVFVHPVTLGTAFGLFFGKQIGVFGICWLSIKTGLATLPNRTNSYHLYGISALTGVGFTMSLFIGSLAFEETGVNLVLDERLGIILGSIFSGILGYLVLRITTNVNEHDVNKE